jgi:hypothetical protein
MSVIGCKCVATVWRNLIGMLNNDSGKTLVKEHLQLAVTILKSYRHYPDKYDRTVMLCMHFPECFILQCPRAHSLLYFTNHVNPIRMFSFCHCKYGLQCTWWDSLWWNMKSVIFMQGNISSVVSSDALQAWLSGVQIPAAASKRLSVLQTIQTGNWAHPAFYLVDTGVLFPGGGGGPLSWLHNPN